MTQQVIILGAKGRFGRAAADAFLAAGWAVRGLARSWDTGLVDPRVERVTADAFDADALSSAVMGADVIVNALNPPYPTWARDVPRLTASVIAAAKASGASVLLPGNVYNYGARMPPVLSEATPHRPTTRKGRLREAMENAYAEAADDGVQTIILRAGDFIEREKTGNWFDTYIAVNAARGRVTYPGPLQHVHAWAYLPDLARAMVGLAEKRGSLGPFVPVGFEGFNLTGRELVEAMQRVAGRKLKIGGMPWGAMRLISPFAPTIREVLEMRYLWTMPHAIDGSKLAALLPDFRPTPLIVALTDSMPATAPRAVRAGRAARARV
jgi:nucleoside-diphosphate-sugar epimerase